MPPPLFEFPYFFHFFENRAKK